MAASTRTARLTAARCVAARAGLSGAALLEQRGADEPSGGIGEDRGVSCPLSPTPAARPTAGIALPAGYAGVEQCSTNSPLAPRGGRGVNRDGNCGQYLRFSGLVGHGRSWVFRI